MIIWLLQSVLDQDRAAYGAIKAIELLYLISTDSPLLTIPPESVSRDHYLTGYGAAGCRSMVSHLSDPLTIDQLSARFRISPTALEEIDGRPTVVRSISICSKSGCSMLPSCCESLSIVILAAVGYNSASQFGVRSSAAVALTPSQYRRQARKS